RTVTAPLGEVAAAAQQAGLVSPALVLIGPVVALRERIQWFEKQPLFGKRVLVTRPQHQAAGFVARLEEDGAIPVPLTVLGIRDPIDWCPVDAALARLGTYDWLVFTSANGVHAFLRRLRQSGRDLRAVGRMRIAVIGPSTADALRCYHLEPDVLPEEYS